MYTSTGAITGIIIVGMFLLSPTAIWAGRVAVFGLAAVIIVGTLPYRKGIAIAIDVLVTNKWASPTASDDSNLPDNTIHH